MTNAEPWDPCNCTELCPHQIKCAGGHALDPQRHWWPTCDEGCFKPSVVIHPLKLGGYVAIVTGCGHGLVVDSPSNTEIRKHLTSCPIARS